MLEGGLNIDAKKVAKNLLRATASYLNNQPNSVLKRIDIVIYQDQMVEEFSKALKKYAEKKSKSTKWAKTVKDYVLGNSGKYLCMYALVVGKLDTV